MSYWPWRITSVYTSILYDLSHLVFPRYLLCLFSNIEDMAVKGFYMDKGYRCISPDTSIARLLLDNKEMYPHWAMFHVGWWLRKHRKLVESNQCSVGLTTNWAFRGPGRFLENSKAVALLSCFESREGVWVKVDTSGKVWVFMHIRIFPKGQFDDQDLLGLIKVSKYMRVIHWYCFFILCGKARTAHVVLFQNRNHWENVIMQYPHESIFPRILHDIWK